MITGLMVVSQLKRKKSGANLSVLALTGEEHMLSESDVDKVLHSGTVLSLFGPSRALLEAVHKATKTPIDIPSLELADGLPLLVYMSVLHQL